MRILHREVFLAFLNFTWILFSFIEVLNTLKYTDLKCTIERIFFQISPYQDRKYFCQLRYFPHANSSQYCSSQRSLLEGFKFHLYNTRIGTKISEMYRPFDFHISRMDYCPILTTIHVFIQQIFIEHSLCGSH